MGIGFCLVVAAAQADRALGALKDLGIEAYHLGRAVADPERRIHLPNGLVGQGNNFRRGR
jgi:phosphoribosylaminoimidazole (AIR) synthetase